MGVCYGHCQKERRLCKEMHRSSASQQGVAYLRPHHPLKTIKQVIADMPGAKVFSILDAKCGFWQMRHHLRWPYSRRPLAGTDSCMCALYYDRNAQTLPPLQQSQTGRMQTARGFDKLMVIQGPAFVVTSQGRQCTWNRHLLLHVQEPAPTEGVEDDYRYLSPPSPPTAPLSSAVLPSQSEAPATDAASAKAQPKVTRSERVSSFNPSYQDYLTS